MKATKLIAPWPNRWCYRTGTSLLVAGLLLSNISQAANFVAVKAFATEEYLKERALNNSKKVQTYHFMEGRHFKGISRDKGLENMTFEELARDLVVHLVKQNFYPEPNLQEGDLLIVVHYGVTAPEEDLAELLGYTNPMELIDLGFHFSSDSRMSSFGMSRREKAQILGIDDTPVLPAHFQSNYEFEYMMKEPRYFVVLMAFDYPGIRTNDGVKLLWSTRYNIRSPGQSFQTAIKEMNAVGSDYFGKNMGKLKRKRLDDKSRVVIGEIEVLGTESQETDSN